MDIKEIINRIENSADDIEFDYFDGIKTTRRMVRPISLSYCIQHDTGVQDSMWRLRAFEYARRVTSDYIVDSISNWAEWEDLTK